jgi:gustatory receptor
LAASIHDASNFPLEVLKAVPYEGWCVEIQRFIDQIRSQTMAFSGYKFFYLTRQTILAVSEQNFLYGFESDASVIQMLTTIVTYELVLLQFDSDSDEQVDHTLNINECGDGP